MSDSVESVKQHVRSYKIIGAALTVLTIVTVAVSYFHFGKEGDSTWNIVVALIIATIKAAMVATIFMHLFWDMFVKMAVIFKVMIFTAVFFIGMMALTLWNLEDPIGKSQKIGPMFPHQASSHAEHHEH